MLRIREEDERLEPIVEVLRHLGDGALVLEVTAIAHAANEPARLDAPAIVGREPLEAVDPNIVQVGERRLAPRDALLERKHGPLVLVDANGHDDLIEEASGPAQNVLVPPGDRVERAGEHRPLDVRIRLHGNQRN